jgi:protein TonB
MRKDRKNFLMMLCAAAFLHGGALFLVPDFSRRDQRETGGRQALPIALNFAPVPLPAPPAVEKTERPPPKPPAESQPVTERADPKTSVARAETAPALTEGAAGFPEGDPEPRPRQELLLRYQGIIRSMIDQRKEYPYQARRQEQEGKVEVRFVLSRQGGLIGEPALSRKSRYDRLNTSALAAVKNAAPYPPFPPEIPLEELSFSVTLSFSLTGNRP